LIIVGDYDNDYGRSLLQLVSKQVNKTNIIFSGKVFNVNDFLNRSELFVLPTLNKGRKEGSPVAILEAMACGLNVIGSKIPGIKDQLKGFEGHLFKAGDENDLGIKLRHFMLLQSIENHDIGKNFRSHVKDNFSLNHEVNKTENVYLNLMKLLDV
jgi:glycosyltransferase involved in cell wall biosynthesis